MSRPRKKDGSTSAEWIAEQKGSASAEAKALKAKLELLTEENGRLAKLLGLVESYRMKAGESPRWLLPKRRPEKGVATACLQFSDLHLDEVVDPAEVGGLNAYNREIALKRLRRWAFKACELGDRFKHNWEGALLFWGGDMVSGAIHAELRETNEDDLPGTVTYWAPMIAAAIKTVADFYGRVHVASVVGNHGRLTEKMQAKRRGRNSWDWLLVQMVKMHLATDERITWDVAPGSYLIVPIYGTNAFLTHGDEVNGGSGWSGVWTPLMTIHRKGEKLAKAHGVEISYSVIGHWHQCVLAHAQGIACNPSMKGWDEYAASRRFTPEPAMQNWWAHTPTRGVTVAAPLFLEDRKAEGWA